MKIKKLINKLIKALTYDYKKSIDRFIEVEFKPQDREWAKQRFFSHIKGY